MKKVHHLPVSSMNSKTDLKQTVDFNSEENDPSF
jgi:hypothetical protein